MFYVIAIVHDDDSLRLDSIHADPTSANNRRYNLTEHPTVSFGFNRKDVQLLMSGLQEDNTIDMKVFS